MNKVFITGRLVANPEAFTTRAGNDQAKIRIASNDNRSRDTTYFFPCIAWGNQAKFINTYLKKGDFVIIDGKLTSRTYTTKDGKTAYVTEVVIDAVQSANFKEENTSGLSLNTLKKEESKSIADSFENNILSKTEVNDQQKINTPSFDHNKEVEFEDSKKEEWEN